MTPDFVEASRANHYPFFLDVGDLQKRNGKFLLHTLLGNVDSGKSTYAKIIPTLCFIQLNYVLCFKACDSLIKP